jgi:nascent polypeptide-associated complex subunit alpha
MAEGAEPPIGDAAEGEKKAEAEPGEAAGETPGDGKPADGKTTPRKNSRAEKKMKEALLKFNLKPLEKIATVMMRKSTQVIWTFNNPDVYYLENVYVVFGEPSMQDAGQQAVQELKKTAAEEEPAPEPEAKVIDDEAASQETPSDLKEDDINTLMSQANVPRSRAIEALREADGDLVTAVMNLTF